MRFVGATLGVGIGQSTRWLVWGSIAIISATTAQAQVTASELSLLWMPSGTYAGREGTSGEAAGLPLSRPHTGVRPPFVPPGDPVFFWGGNLGILLGGFSVDAHRSVWRAQSKQPFRIQVAWGAPYQRDPARPMQRAPLRTWALGMSTVRHSAPARAGTPMSTGELWLRRNGVMLIVRPTESIVHLRPQWGSVWLHTDPRRGVVRGGSVDLHQNWGDVITTMHAQFWPSPSSHEATARFGARWPTKPQTRAQHMIRLTLRSTHHQLQTLSYTIARRSARWGGSLDHTVQPKRTRGIHSMGIQGFVRTTRMEWSAGMGYSWPHGGWHWTSQGRFAPTRSLLLIRASQTTLHLQWRQGLPRAVPGSLTLTTNLSLVRHKTRAIGSTEALNTFYASPVGLGGYQRWGLSVDGTTNTWSLSAGAQFDHRGASLSLSARRRSRQSHATWRFQHAPTGTWQSRVLWTLRGDHQGSPGQDAAENTGATRWAGPQPSSLHRTRSWHVLPAALARTFARSTARLFPPRVRIHVRDSRGKPVAASVFYGMNQRRTNATGRVTFKDAQSGDQLWVDPDDPLLHVPEEHQGAKLGRRATRTVTVHPMRWLDVRYAEDCPQERNAAPSPLPPHWRPPSTVSIPFTPQSNRPSVVLGRDEQQRIALRSDHPFWLVADQHGLGHSPISTAHAPGAGPEATQSPTLPFSILPGTKIGQWHVTYGLHTSPHATTLNVYACPQPAPIIWQP